MDKKSNVRVVGFPKENYDKTTLESLSDREKSEWACADGNTEIFEDLQEFQDVVLNYTLSCVKLVSNWWFFLND